MKSIFLESIRILKGPDCRPGEIGVPTGMAPTLNAVPILFDRPLLRVRQDRARRGGAATFLLDRVAEDLAERLQAVLGGFNSAADNGPPGDQLRHALPRPLRPLSRIHLPDIPNQPVALRPV